MTGGFTKSHTRKPGVIAFIRSRHSAEFVPDWVGEPEGDVDYRALLRNAGVDVPAVDDSDSMDDVADGVATDDGGSMDDAADGVADDNSTMEGQDVQVGTPVQGSTVGDVDPKSPAVIDIQEQTQVHTHIHQQQHPSTPPSAEASTGSSTAPPTQRPIQLKTKLPAPTLPPKSKVVPPQIVEVPEPVLQKQSPARERLVEELKKLQTHDPSIVPMEGMVGSS